MDEESIMDGAPTYFERLVATAERIIRHADYPGKRETIDQCLEDVESLWLDGQITTEQREVLRDVLSGAFSHAV